MKNSKGCKKKVCLIGGQALLEGVMMQGATATAMSVRTPEGKIVTEAKRKKKVSKWLRIPVVRGVVSFISSLVVGTKCIMKSSSQAFPEEESPSVGTSIFATILGLVLAIVLFMLLPSFLSSLISEWMGWGVLAHSIIEGVIRILLFVGYLLLVSLMPDIKRTFMYHGAEHRTINCFEHGEEMTVANIQKHSTRHNRCGTTFLFFVMVVSILVFSLVSWITQQCLGYMPGKFTMVAIRLLCLPFVAGISYELLRFLALLPDNKFVDIFRAPGLGLQKLTTYPPEDDMVEVALTAFMAVLRMDSDPSYPERDFGEYFSNEVKEDLSRSFGNAGIYASDAEWIIAKACGLKRSELSGKNIITKDQYAEIERMAQLRMQKTPIDYIFGESNFFGLTLNINRNTLIPRPETEMLCEQAMKIIGEKECDVLDLMTGSGCIAAAIAANTSAHVTASDISEDAVAVAKSNLDKYGAKVVISDAFSEIEGQFDMIVSNPPYIRSGEIPLLQEEVRREPIIALDGGADGLDFYRIIAENSPEVLKPNGVLLLEIGFDQADAVTEILKQSFCDITVMKDLEGNDRIVIAHKNN